MITKQQQNEENRQEKDHKMELKILWKKKIMKYNWLNSQTFSLAGKDEKEMGCVYCCLKQCAYNLSE